MKVDVPAGLTRIRTIISAPITVGNSLIGPDNIVYDSILSQSGAAKEQYRTFTINDPLPGEWTIEIRNRNFESEERVLVAVEETGSPIELQMGVSGPDSSRRLTIYAKVVDSGKILKDLEMNAEFQYVGLSSNIYQMYDDGEHNDGLPNDGIYAASSSSLTPGGHLIIVTARNEELVRIAAVSVYIPE
jgi:hypothetical protein